MKRYFVIVAIAFNFTECNVQKRNENLKWIESQTLCVYWSPDFKKRDTLSAINFVVESKSDNILKKGEFSFIIGTKSYVLKKTRLVDKIHFFHQGLKLPCSELYEDFKDDIYAEDGPCYENTLYKMVNEGRLFLKPSTEIRKVDSFDLYRGLKEK